MKSVIRLCNHSGHSARRAAYVRLFFAFHRLYTAGKSPPTYRRNAAYKYVADKVRAPYKGRQIRHTRLAFGLLRPFALKWRYQVSMGGKVTTVSTQTNLLTPPKQ